MRKNLSLLIILCFSSALITANVRSIYAEQVGQEEVCVSFSSNYNSCTVHWRKKGEARWQSYYCDYGDGSLTISRLAAGTYEFRVTPENSNPGNTNYGKCCEFTIRYGMPRYNQPPRRNGPPPSRHAPSHR